MFDDPKKALLDLERALLAEEEPAREDFLDEDEDLLREVRAMLDGPQEAPGGVYLRQEPEKPMKTKGIGDLVVLAALEAALIAAIALWWLQWLF